MLEQDCRSQPKRLVPAVGGVWREVNVCTFLRLGVHGDMHVYSPANFKLDLAVSRKPEIQARVSSEQGSMLVHSGALVNMVCLWDKHANAACLPVSAALDQLASSRHVGWIRRPGIWSEGL